MIYSMFSSKVLVEVSFSILSSLIHHNSFYGCLNLRPRLLTALPFCLQNK